jgi:serine/threonine protein kinase
MTASERKDQAQPAAESKLKIEIRQFPVFPNELRLRDLKENGKLWTEEEIKRAKDRYQQTAKEKKSAVMLSKEELASAYSAIFPGDSDVPYIIYKGKKETDENMLREQRCDSDSDDENGFTKPYQLGEGGFGEVKIAQDSTTQTFHALKFSVLDSGSKEPEMIQKSGQGKWIMSQAASKDANKNEVYLMNLAPGVELHEYHQLNDHMPIYRLIQIILGMLQCLKEVHGKNIIHDDIKLANFKFDPVSGRVTLVDFGLAMEGKKDQKIPTRATGTPGHIAPEHKIMGLASQAGDIYSMGISIAMLLDLITPETLNLQGFALLRKGFTLKDFNCSSRIKDFELMKKILPFLQQMTHATDSSRPDIDACIDFFKKIQLELNQKRLLEIPKIGIIDMADVVQPKDSKLDSQFRDNFDKVVQQLKQEKCEEVWFVDTNGQYTDIQKEHIQKEQVKRRLLRRGIPVADKIFTAPGADFYEVFKQAPLIVRQNDQRIFNCIPFNLPKPAVKTSDAPVAGMLAKKFSQPELMTRVKEMVMDRNLTLSS